MNWFSSSDTKDLSKKADHPNAANSANAGNVGNVGNQHKKKEISMIGKKDDKSASKDEVMAFLGQGTEFKGVITYDGTIRIDGKVQGEIISKGTLIIGQNADINAEINAGTVVSAGTITGNLVATKKVQLQAPAVLNGSIKSPIVIIEEGVTFNGNCEMKITEQAAGNQNRKSSGKSAEMASKSA